MDKDKITLSKEDIERLCSLYMEGQLSVAEEHDLSILLSQYVDYDSELIDDTLLIMGLSRSAAVSGGCKSKKKTWFCHLFTAGTAAAVLLAMIGMGWHFMAHKGRDMGPETIFEVYVGGKKVLDTEKSREIALEKYNSSMELLANMRQLEIESRQQLEKMEATL